MNKITWWLLGLALCGSSALLMMMAAFDWTAGTCRMPAGDGGKPLATGALACVEFWLNRYQGLVGAVSSVAAAIYAGYWVAKQIKRTDHQIALARAQLSGDFIESIKIRIKKIKQFESAVSDIKRNISSIVSAVDTNILEIDSIIVMDEAEYIQRAMSHNLSEFKEAAFENSRLAQKLHIRYGIETLDPPPLKWSALRYGF